MERRIDLDDEDVRLLLLWAWQYAKSRNSFSHRHVKKLTENNKHLMTSKDLKEILGEGL